MVLTYAANTHNGTSRNYNEDRISIVLDLKKPGSKPGVKRGSYNTKKKQKQEQEKINLLKSKEKEIKPIEEVNFDDEQGNGKIKGGLYDN